MNLQLVEKIVNAMLYEGYILYPYRSSAVKNQQRFNFGVLTPRSYSEAQHGAERWSMQTECLVLGDDQAAIDVKVRFLQLRAREVWGEVGKPAASSRVSPAEKDLFGSGAFGSRPLPSLEVDGRVYQTWQEAVEREVDGPSLDLESLLTSPERFTFSFPADQERERLRERSGRIVGAVMRKQEAIEGAIEISVARMTEQLRKLTVRVLNLTRIERAGEKLRDEVLMHSLASAHIILGVRKGEFVSLIDPPEIFREHAALCRNDGVWPVLVGEPEERSVMLSSPIILYDYPQIAPESPGDLFDGTEIDEILMLRIMTLTDEEKREMRQTDERARQILERTETLPPEQLMKLHGALRGLRSLDE
jgi:hydrogenase maturation protease